MQRLLVHSCISDVQKSDLVIYLVFAYVRFSNCPNYLQFDRTKIIWTFDICIIAIHIFRDSFCNLIGHAKIWMFIINIFSVSVQAQLPNYLNLIGHWNNLIVIWICWISLCTQTICFLRNLREILIIYLGS
jgi:hypothetical protein